MPSPQNRRRGFLETRTSQVAAMVGATCAVLTILGAVHGYGSEIQTRLAVAESQVRSVKSDLKQSNDDLSDRLDKFDAKLDRIIEKLIP